ncbi:MAG: murein DD-endopeptidase MepM/ murein hydrolase activator NlpD [Vicingaceae bacterium]|jgi:murein DD-endopeptidase MepM/ murein hydrolase activator NlpD
MAISKHYSHKFIVILIALVASTRLDAQKDESKKLIVPAIVINTNSRSASSNISNLNGEQIIELVDSLLSLDSVPDKMLDELSDYVENKRLQEDIYVLLTGFYDTSMYPSRSMYKKWDTYQLFNEVTSDLKVGESRKLVLEDTLNECRFYNPYKGLITSNFGWRSGRAHNGIDIDLEVWDPVVASFDGMVRVARMHTGYGRVVIIRHYNGLETLYAHLHRLKVKPGDIVEAGQVIGLGGSSGRSSGSHLHFEVRFKGKPLNPKSIIDFNNNKLKTNSIKLVKTKYSFAAVPDGVNFHTVKKGESLFKIAILYGTSVTKLCSLNSIKRNRTLQIGQKLMVAQL